MTDMPGEESFKQAIQAIKSGDKANAQKLLAASLSANPNNDQAWLLLAGCVDEPAKKRYCVQKALAIRPENQEAQRVLEKLTPSQSAQREKTHVEIGQESEPPRQPEALQAQKGRQPTKQETRVKKSRLSCLQFSMLILLSLVALGALSGAGFMLLNSGLLFQPPNIQPPDQPITLDYGTPGPVAQFPPTWTWTPESAASPTATQLAIPPSATVGIPRAQVPSITPFSWRWTFTIGYSVEKRPIIIYQFGAGQRERMIVAGIHGGDEWNTIDLADELIVYLQDHPEIIPSGTTLYILRSLNPDGEAKGHSPDGRVNHNGVDLNRNWSANWKADWNREGCWSERPTTGGAFPNSEPETQALANFLIGRRVEALISYHSAGLGIFPSGDPPNQESARLAEELSKVSSYIYPPADTGCEYTGTLPDWALMHGIVAVDLELPTASGTDFDTNLKILNYLLAWEPQQTPTDTPSSTSTAEISETPILEFTGIPTLESTVTPTVSATPSPSTTP
jgi:hypothetical protein